MINESSIRRRLEAVRRHQADVFDFGDWLDSESWNLHKASPAVFQMASAVHRIFSEYDYHHSESALRSELISLLGEPNIAVRLVVRDNVISSRPLEFFGSANSVAAYPQPVAV